MYVLITETSSDFVKAIDLFRTFKNQTYET